MARMYPDVPASDLEHASEEPVYLALRDQLGEDYAALHSYPWLRPWRGDALLEGEADFVVLHPQRGILVLEVKGGEDIRHDGRRWFRSTSSGPKEFQDPFVQARRNMHALLDIVRERSGHRLAKEDLARGYAVVFPHLDYEGLPPPHADKAIIISRKHLPMMAQAIDAAYRAWTDAAKAAKPLGHEQYRMLLHDCLMPKFRVFRPVGPDISKAAERLLELTETQAQVFEGLFVEHRVLVEGVAGSGKTFLALHRALAFAREGKRTLFVCYNRELATWLRVQVEEDPTTSQFRELVTIKNFHSLAADLARDAGIEFRPQDGGEPTDSFWNDEVPDLVEQAILHLGEAAQYEAIVVDEAQDFCLGWWYALTNSVLSQPDGPLYAFLDPHQSLRGKVQWPDVEFGGRFKLTINCRNTQRIAAASASVLSLTPHIFKRAPLGTTLRVLRAGSDRQQKGLVLQELRSLLQREGVAPKQIAVIGPAAKDKGSLADVRDVAGVPLVTSALTWRAGGGVLVTTARSFKGLEAEVVVLYDLGGFGTLFKREDLYVSCTRAKVLLVAVVHGDQCREAIAAAQVASEAER
ncbi:nuclease-related domain-containing DEAD/DEAH box helicase [Teichococcus vastitatis]|uniref:DNA 3'-5' helicase II n=1 Tax=Teichococcus vastitatis TaxID=2307076 RepID=A0ABS9VYW5_9PROT|nr:NERD domain-containing protein [Pseudoroseomonas vastitatis]MCI0752157.1 NERD domain-containing protein [Pseudoroseomonas vastitatis]